MQDTDIEGLGPREAYEYVLAFITTLKQAQMEIARVSEEARLWEGRVALARQRSDAVLAEQAQARLSSILAKKAGLEAELADLTAKVSILKEKLTRMRQRLMRTVDTDLLLAQLQMAVGEKDVLSDSLKAEEANVKLEELKKKMGQ